MSTHTEFIQPRTCRSGYVFVTAWLLESTNSVRVRWILLQQPVTHKKRGGEFGGLLLYLIAWSRGRPMGPSPDQMTRCQFPTRLGTMARSTILKSVKYPHLLAPIWVC